MEEYWWRMSHLYVAVFLNIYGGSLTGPPITDVIVAAVCGGKDECSLAIYLTGVQQAISGLGGMVMMPLFGNLSDIYGRKPLFLVCISLSIVPLAILAWNRTTNYVYAYFAFKTITTMATDGGAIFLGLAYLADNVVEEKRVSAFGLMSAVVSAGFVSANFTARLLPTSLLFQAGAIISILAVAYAAILIKETRGNDSQLEQPILHGQRNERMIDDSSSNKNTNLFKRSIPSPWHIISLFKRSKALSLLFCVGFFNFLAEAGNLACLMYSLKARFHFMKNQFAEITLICDFGSILSNMFFVPLVGPFIGAQRLLAIGLFAGFFSFFLDSIAWSSWVLYAASCLGFFFAISQPNLKSLISSETGPDEQGIVQGCISSISSLSNLVAPLIFSPLTALFLSDDPPFYFPGFSLFCIALANLIAFILSVFVKITPVVSRDGVQRRP